MRDSNDIGEFIGVLTTLIIAIYYLFIYVLDILFYFYQDRFWFTNIGVVGIVSRVNCRLDLSRQARTYVYIGQFF